MATYGATTGIPTLWLYSETTACSARTLRAALREAYVGAGGEPSCTSYRHHAGWAYLMDWLEGRVHW